MCKYSCKILKTCLPQLPQKWKTTNMLVVNNIYFHVRPTLTDTSWIQSLNTTVQISQAEYATEMRKIHRDLETFHTKNYLKWWKNVGWRTMGDLSYLKKHASNEHDHLVFTEEGGNFGEDYLIFLYNTMVLTEEEKRQALYINV